MVDMLRGSVIASPWPVLSEPTKGGAQAIMRHTYRSLAQHAAPCVVLYSAAWTGVPRTGTPVAAVAKARPCYREQYCDGRVWVESLCPADAMAILADADLIVAIDRYIGDPFGTTRMVLVLSNLAYEAEQVSVTRPGWDRVWVPTPFLQDRVHELVPQLAGRVDVIPPVVASSPSGPSSVTVRVSAMLAARGIGRSHVLIFPHRADPQKGLLDALSLLERLVALDRRWCLVVTEPSYLDDMANHRFFREAVAQAHVRGLAPHVALVPWLASTQMSSLYELGDCTVVASSLPESFGLVVAESVAAGTPVVAKATGSLEAHCGSAVTLVANIAAEATTGITAHVASSRVPVVTRHQLEHRYSTAGHDAAVQASLRTLVGVSGS